MGTTPGYAFPYPASTGLVKDAPTDFSSLAQAVEDTIKAVPTNKNIVINGAMQVAQRGTSTASITTSGYFTADRWLTQVGSLGTWTHTVENDGPTGSGLRKSVKILCTTADASPAAGDYHVFYTRLEGQDCQRILKGTSSAQQLTLSFWVKSNVTGTYVINLIDDVNSRMVSTSYSISASATWQKKTITIPADTTGVLNNDNNGALQVLFWLGAGSNWTSGSLSTSWASMVSANRAVGQTNLAAATNNYWQVTGVQLEVGAVATGFEFEPYETTLRKCQRYYFRFSTSGASAPYGMFGFTTSATDSIINTKFPVTMRTAPTALEQTGTASNYRVYSPATSANCSSVPTFNNATVENALTACFLASGQTTGQGAILTNGTGGAASYLGWSAEL